VVLIETDDERSLEDGVDIVLVFHVPRIHEAVGKPVTLPGGGECKGAFPATMA
jgi:hypothetical protein